MSEEFNQAEMDYFAAEDLAIDRVKHELMEQPWNMSEDMAEEYKKLMQRSGTAMIHGEGFSITRNPETLFEITPDKSTHADEEQLHAA